MGGLLRPSQHANPAHFIVPNTLSRVRTARITCSVFDRRIPSSAFVNVGDGVFVASPELCLRKLSPGSLVGRRHDVRPTPPDVYVEIAIVPLSRSKPQRSRHGAESRPAYPAELRIAQGVAAIHTQQLSRTPRRIRIPATDVEPPCAHLGEGSGAERGRNMPLRPVLARRETRRRIRQSASPCRRGRAGEGLGLHTRSEMDKVAHAMAKRLGTRCRSRAHDWELKQIRLRSQLLGTTRLEMLDAKTAPMTIIDRRKRPRPSHSREKAWPRFATKPK